MWIRTTLRFFEDGRRRPSSRPPSPSAPRAFPPEAMCSCPVAPAALPSAVPCICAVLRSEPSNNTSTAHAHKCHSPLEETTPSLLPTAILPFFSSRLCYRIRHRKTRRSVSLLTSSFGVPLSTFPFDTTRLTSWTVAGLRLLFIIAMILSQLCLPVDACSARSTPKPRPHTPTMRPNITFQTYACPDAYAAWYCLNGATCFTVKIGEALLYNCECSDGFMGQRCEFKDLKGYYPREKVMLETASIAGGATLAVVMVVVVCSALYVYMEKKKKELAMRNLENGQSSTTSLPVSSRTSMASSRSVVLEYMDLVYNLQHQPADAIGQQIKRSHPLTGPDEELVMSCSCSEEGSREKPLILEPC
ncbi:unnamed protein product [Cyprideis torosa]|uniref:Uncharacterized protein n=1 Tax=Cyprideis torosa TaxID=163714 RepID=A0A7R8W1Q9_9CRUS|nr:unnamed protein product [Cyprideis torosa]CAG0881216.1 unnamed protein product [Cyprideis torosa]